MRPSSKNKFAVAGILLALAVIAPAAVILLAFLARPSYRSVCRAEFTPQPPSMFTAEFAETVFGSDRSIRLRPGRGTTLVSIEALGDSPSVAVERANGAVAKIQAALSRQQPTICNVVDPAEPALRPFRPNKPLYAAIGLCIGGVVGLPGVVMLFVAVQSRRKGDIDQHVRT